MDLYEPLYKQAAQTGLEGIKAVGGYLKNASDWLDDKFGIEDISTQDSKYRAEHARFGTDTLSPQDEMRSPKRIQEAVDMAINFSPMAAGTIYKGFHGTASKVDVFRKEFMGSATGAKSAKQGFWFVDNPKVAGGYATYAAETAPVKKLLDEADTYERIAQKTNSEKYWTKQYNAVKRAEELEKEITKNPMRGQNIIPANLDIKNPMILDAKGENFTGMEEDINKAIRKAKLDGNDGLVIHNLDDAANFSNMPATHYLVFEPKQITSSITKKVMSAEEFLDK